MGCTFIVCWGMSTALDNKRLVWFWEFMSWRSLLWNIVESICGTKFVGTSSIEEAVGCFLAGFCSKCCKQIWRWVCSTKERGSCLCIAHGVKYETRQETKRKKLVRNWLHRTYSRPVWPVLGVRHVTVISQKNRVPVFAALVPLGTAEPWDRINLCRVIPLLWRLEL